MSTSETITRTDLANILNEVLPNTQGIGVYKGAWTSNGTSATGVRVTDELTLSKGLYAIELSLPIPSANFLVGLHVGSDDYVDRLISGGSSTPYARGTFLCSVTADGTKAAAYSESSTSVTYTHTDRGGIKAVQLVRYTESPEADYIVEQGTSGIWTYRKWNSGIAECWGKTSVASTTYSANGGYKNVTESLPSGLFNAIPSVVNASGKINTCVQTHIGFTAPNDATSIQTYLVNRNSSSVTQAGEVYWEVKGTWK